MDQDFPGKEPFADTFFFFFFFFLDLSIAKWSVKEDDTMMNKVAKGKEKTRGNNKKKNCKMCCGGRLRIDIQLSKLRFEATV